MKRIFPFILLTIALFTCLSLYSLEGIRVEFNDSSDWDEVSVTNIDGTPYIYIYELNKVFNAFISEELLDRRIYVDLYNQRLIFLIDSSYVLFDNEVYNFHFNTLYYQGKHYLPLVFLQETLPKILAGKALYDKEKEVLKIDLPDDNSIKTIVLDPGHGGKDPGAVGFSGKTNEKKIVLKVAKGVKEMLEKNLGVNVLLTRSEDKFVPLQERTAFANKNEANLFVSIHCNAAKNVNATGVEVYFLSTANTDEARAVEALENSVVEKYEGGMDAVKKYTDLNYILTDMAQAEYLKESSHLATKLQANLTKATSWNDRGVKQAGFYVLRGAFMPAVLVELGFISNKEEEKKLNSASYQEMLIKAVYEGIGNFIHYYETVR